MNKLVLIAALLLCGSSTTAFVVKNTPSTGAGKINTSTSTSNDETSTTALESTVMDRMAERRSLYSGGYDTDTYYGSRGYGSGYGSRYGSGYGSRYGSSGYGSSYGYGSGYGSRYGRTSNFGPATGQSRVYGGHRQTRQFHYGDDTAYVSLTSDRNAPLVADIEMWSGPGYSPQSIHVYSEDGAMYPFHAVMDTTGGSRGRSGEQSMSILNSGPMEFPIDAYVEANRGPNRQTGGRMRDIYGGALKTFAFDSAVRSVQVDFETDGLPLMATVELWEGPGDCKILAELQCDDGLSKPLSVILETPGFNSGCTVAVRNTGPMAYPLRASAEPIDGLRMGRYGGRGGYSSSYGDDDRNYRTGRYNSYNNRDYYGSGGYRNDGYYNSGNSYGRNGSYGNYASYNRSPGGYNYMVDPYYYSDGWTNRRYSPSFYSDSYTRLGDSYRRSW